MKARVHTSERQMGGNTADHVTLFVRGFELIAISTRKYKKSVIKRIDSYPNST